MLPFGLTFLLVFPFFTFVFEYLCLFNICVFHFIKCRGYRHNLLLFRWLGYQLVLGAHILGFIKIQRHKPILAYVFTIVVLNILVLDIPHKSFFLLPDTHLSGLTLCCWTYNLLRSAPHKWYYYIDWIYQHWSLPWQCRYIECTGSPSCWRLWPLCLWCPSGVVFCRGELHRDYFIPDTWYSRKWYW